MDIGKRLAVDEEEEEGLRPPHSSWGVGVGVGEGIGEDPALLLQPVLVSHGTTPISPIRNAIHVGTSVPLCLNI